MLRTVGPLATGGGSIRLKLAIFFSSGRLIEGEAGATPLATTLKGEGDSSLYNFSIYLLLGAG